MRQLTLAGFLKRYTVALSKSPKGGFYRWAAEASESNARLRAPLLLYAACEDKVDVLLKATKSLSLRDEYLLVLRDRSPEQLLEALIADDPSLPDEYRKVWQSYVSEKNAGQRDAHTKSLMRARVVKLQKQTGISTYRVYHDLRLNGGNVNAWLKTGDCNKVSLTTARKVVEYMNDQARLFQ